MSKEAKRVYDINDCTSAADIGDYLVDNSFIAEIMKKFDVEGEIGQILEHALYKSEKPNITQYQLKLQSVKAPPRAYAVLLRIMEVRFSLDRLDL